MSVMIHPRETVISPADPSTGEVALFRCGTVAPGAVHDPCQHSVIQVQCCDCAGCIHNVWSCTAPYDEPAWYEPEALARTVDPYLRHPAAVLSYAALTAIGAMTQMIETITHITVFLVSVGVLAVGFGLSQILH